MSLIATDPQTEIAEYSPTAAALAELRNRLANVAYDVTTTKGMEVAKRDRAEVRGLRTSLEKMRQDIKAPALERCRLIDAEAKRITADLLELETPIDEQIKAEEQRKEAEKQARIQAEFGRVQAIQDAIAELHMEAAVTGKPSAFIAERLEAIKALALDPLVYQEMMAQAEQARAMVVGKLETALNAQKFAEAEAAKLAAERAELEQLRAAAAEQKRKDDAAAKAAREAEEERAAAERAKQAAELEAQRAEQRRLDAEASAARAEADAKAAAERAEADRLAREAREAEQRRIDAERAELKRQQDEADAKARADRLAAEAAEQKVRDAAPAMFAALKKVRDMAGIPAAAVKVIDKAIAAAA